MFEGALAVRTAGLLMGTLCVLVGTAFVLNTRSVERLLSAGDRQLMASQATQYLTTFNQVVWQETQELKRQLVQEARRREKVGARAFRKAFLAGRFQWISRWTRSRENNWRTVWMEGRGEPAQRTREEMKRVLSAALPVSKLVPERLTFSVVESGSSRWLALAYFLDSSLDDLEIPREKTSAGDTLLMAFMDLESLSGLLKIFKGGPVSLNLFDDQGVVLAASEYRRMGRSAQKTPFVRQVLQQKKRFFSTDFIEETLGWRGLAMEVGDSNLYAAAVFPLTDQPRLVQRWRFETLLKVLALLCMGLFIVAWVVRRLELPLRGIGQILEKMGAGQMHAAVDIKGPQLVMDMAENLERIQNRWAAVERSQVPSQKPQMTRSFKEELDRAVGGFAHQLAAPVTVVLGKLKKMRGRSQDREAVLELESLAQDVESVKEMLQSVERVSRPDQERREKCHLVELVQRAVDQVKEDWCSADVEVHSHLEEVTQIYGFPKRLQSTFVQVLQKGLGVLKEQSSRELIVQLSESEELIEFSVMAVGVSWAPHQLRRRESSASNLAPVEIDLLTVFSALRAHRGDLFIENDSRPGAQILVLLPRGDEDVHKVLQRRSGADHPTAGDSTQDSSPRGDVSDSCENEPEPVAVDLCREDGERDGERDSAEELVPPPSHGVENEEHEEFAVKIRKPKIKKR